MVEEKSMVVYSTDSDEHRFNIGEEDEEFSTLGMYQDENGEWFIKEELIDHDYDWDKY